MKILGDKRKKEEVHSYKILFEMYKSKVYRIAYYIVKNEQDAKDIVQEAFTIAYIKKDTLRDLSKFESWICTIACNLAKDKYNKRKKEILTDDYEKVIPLSIETEFVEIPEDSLEKKELKSKIREHINNLDSHYREVIVNYYYLELTYEEISKVLGVSVGTVKSRIFRAKNIIKDYILKDNGHESIIMEARRNKNA